MKIQSLTNTRLVLALLAAGVVGGAGVTVVSAQRADGTAAPFVSSAHAAPAAAPVAALAGMNGAPDFSAITQRYGPAVVNISVVGTAGAEGDNPLAQGGVDTSTNEAWAARAQEKIATMDAAASVSERARDDRFTAMLIGIIADVQDALGFTDEDKECSNGSLEIVAAIRELKEQALTQQRGAPVFDRAWVVRDAELRAAAYNLLNLVEGVGCERWQNANGFRRKDTQQWVEFYIATKNVQSFGEVTTPQPSADAARELVLLSRGLAKRTFNRSTAEMYIHFADELESCSLEAPMPKYDRELIARMLETPSVFEDASRCEQARLLREADNLEADARTVVRTASSGEGVG